MLRISWLASSLQDLRQGVVLLRRDARVSGLIVGVLALGIGGTAAIFTLLKAAFLDPLPYRDAGRLVTVMEDNGWNANASEFVEIRARSRTLEQVAYVEHRDMQISGTGEPIRVFGARVSLGLAASTTIRSLTNTEAAGSPVMYAAVAVLFLAVTLVAASLPVRRASRLDPAVALRCE